MSDAESLKLLGNAAIQAKNYTEAVDYFTKAIALNDKNHVYFSNRSAAYAHLKQYSEALKDAEKTIEINPSWPKGYSRKGAAQHGLGAYEDAIESYNKCLELDPNNAGAKAGINDAKHELESGGPAGGMAELQRKFMDPNLIQKLKTDPKTAEMMKDPAFVAKVENWRLNPTGNTQELLSDPRMMTVLGAILGIDMNAGPEPPAQAAAQAAAPEPKPAAAQAASKPKAEPKKTEPKADEDVTMEEDSEEAKAQKEADAIKDEANKLYKAKKFTEAIEKYNQAWNLHKDVKYLNNRAAAEFENGDIETCIKTCEEAVEKARELRSPYQVIAKSLQRIGAAYAKQEDYENAVKYYEKSLTENRTADVLAKLKAIKKVKKEKEMKEYIDPEKAEAARLEGMKYFKQSNWPEAVKAYEEMIKRAPYDPRGYSNKAAALAKLMSFDQALENYELAIKQDPLFIKAYIRKATSEIAMKKFGAAVKTLQEATSKADEALEKKTAEIKASGKSPEEIKELVDKETNEHKKYVLEINQISYKAMSSRFATVENETPEQTFARVSKDPEVAEILQDPIMNSILSQAKENPAALQEHMKNPEIARKIELLIAAGIIRTR